MPRLRSLFDIFSGPTYATDLIAAKKNSCCVICKQAADTFSNAMFKFEFHNSGLCETCQEHFFFSDGDSPDDDNP